MGRRSRAQNITRKVVAAANALREDDLEDAIATVRSYARLFREDGDPIVLAPAYASASYLAIAAIQRAGLPLNVENQSDVTRMLVDAMVDAANDLTIERLAEHREQRRTTA